MSNSIHHFYGVLLHVAVFKAVENIETAITISEILTKINAPKDKCTYKRVLNCLRQLSQGQIIIMLKVTNINGLPFFIIKNSKQND